MWHRTQRVLCGYLIPRAPRHRTSWRGTAPMLYHAIQRVKSRNAVTPPALSVIHPAVVLFQLQLSRLGIPLFQSFLSPLLSPLPNPAFKRDFANAQPLISAFDPMFKSLVCYALQYPSLIVTSLLQ